MRVKFDREPVYEATNVDDAFAGLEKLFAGDIPALVTRRAGEIGYDLESHRALAVLAMWGLSVEKGFALRKMGQGRRHSQLGLHADGYVSETNTRFHHHETLELAPGATASCTLIRAKRDKPDRYYLAEPSRWSDYVDLASGTIDDDFFYPVLYQAELSVGDTVDFGVSGQTVMVHQFGVDPPDSIRTVSVKFIS